MFKKESQDITCDVRQHQDKTQLSMEEDSVVGRREGNRGIVQ
jgi:hypothetical protein